MADAACVGGFKNGRWQRPPLTEFIRVVRRKLGRTGLMVSCLGVGTVELGMDYGIPVPGDFGRPSQADAIAILHTAAHAGVNLFDTAPNYGVSEELLGTTLARRSDCYFATKVSIPTSAGKPLTGPSLKQAVEQSLQRSLHALRRDVLDVVQIHNATLDVIQRGEMSDLLVAARGRGDVRCLGASVYGEDAAMAAIDAGCFDVIQVAYNLLDQRMASRVFPAAHAAGVGVLARSPLLKGALTAKSQWLPPQLDLLRRAAERVRTELGIAWDELPVAALRFCLSTPDVTSVVFGPRTSSELQTAINATTREPWHDGQRAAADRLALSVGPLVDPSTWSVP